jgi:Yip1 domain
MLNALLLFFAPARTWERIADSRRAIFYVLITYLLPIMLLTAFGEGYGLVHSGKWQGEPSHIRKLSLGESIVFEAGQFLATLLIIVVNAGLVKSVGSTFHGRHTFTQGFTAVSYGLAPLFLCRLLNVFSDVNPWLSWAIGILLSIALLYHGVPITMDPDPAHAFGLYVITSLMLFMTTGMLELITAFYLHGNFPKLEHAIISLAARLPF